MNETLSNSNLGLLDLHNKKSKSKNKKKKKRHIFEISTSTDVSSISKLPKRKIHWIFATKLTSIEPL